MKKTVSVFMVFLGLALLSGCSGVYNGPNDNGPTYNNQNDLSGETHENIIENEFVLTEDMPVSTFSTDVDTASYSNIRRMLNSDTLPDHNAVRIEEMVNYFSYDFEGPNPNEVIKVYSEMGLAPWQDKHQLMMIGLKTEDIEFNESVGLNLVFLIDVSGSMYSSDKLPLLKQAMKLLVENLRPIDKISIVVYAGASGVILEGADKGDKTEIYDAIDKLQAGGSTAGGEGIKLAYKVAERHFIEGGNNRIIIASDGDFNVGISNPTELKDLVSSKKDSGVFLSVLGFGTGNYRDDMMESIADHGNGAYYYIDTIKEAEKVLVHELGGTMITVAKDVKIQIEFNPKNIKGYRLIGYENRILNNDEFDDDKVDAGDMGSGHVVVAFYEIIPAGVNTEVGSKSYDEQRSLRYDGNNFSDEFAHVSIRYKDPTKDTSKLIEQGINSDAFTLSPSNDFKFASSVVEFGLLLRDSKYKGTSSFDQVIDKAQGSIGLDKFEYRDEFVTLVKIAKRLSNKD